MTQDDDRTVWALITATRELVEDIERLVSTATAELGPIDILVHNAGGDIAAAGGKPTVACGKCTAL